MLLRGPSGAGKSDLALRLVQAGGRLVADDQTHLAAHRRRLVATPPPALAGLIEVRGVGIVRLPRRQLLPKAVLALIIDLVPPQRVERLPEPASEVICDIPVPLLSLAPFEASAVTKLHLALAQTIDA
jgi:serine kinase of HPr protein (carbohydrate metabolism regulator)